MSGCPELEWELKRLRAALSATEEALLEATDNVELARRLSREQIDEWRHAGRSWTWIKYQPAARLFYAIGGS